MPSQGALPPSAVVWDWRRERAAETASRERASARRRGLVQGAVGLVAAGLLYWLWRPVPAAVVAGIALLTLALALISPTGGYRLLTRAIEAFAHGVGMAVTWLLMTLLYFVFFLPAGLLLRARHKLGITVRPERALSSYWSAAPDRPHSAESYRKQF